jgi:integrase
MSTLREHLSEYLTLRRALGCDLQKLELLAGQFCDWLTTQGKTTFTTTDAVTWARLPVDANRQWWAIRLGAVRTFAAYLNAIGVDVQVPPPRTLPAGSGRPTPFIYSQQDLNALLDACGHVFTRPLVSATMSTVIGLLGATGLRIGEALRLTVADIDTTTGVLTIRANKHGPDRLVPIHPSTTEHLLAYQDRSDRQTTRPAPDGPLLVSTRGTGYHRASIEAHFVRVIRAAGLESPGHARPRLHDLRHTFATAHMAAAYRTGADPQRTLTLLATWLGHTSAAHTYWYLSASPQLMALAADRLHTEKGRP